MRIAGLRRITESRPTTRLQFGVLLATVAALMLLGTPPALAANRWRRVDTETFSFIFTERDREAAQAVMEMAPDVYRRSTEYLGYAPRERVPVVIYGDTAFANGFFSPYPPRIALFVSSPSGPWLGGATESWLEVLFVHELIHYLHLTQPIGFFGGPSRVFGPLMASASLVFAPGWFIEGPTTYGESALAPGGRGDNPFFEKLHIAPILEERMYSYDQAGFMSPFAPSGRIYAGGYLMVEHLLAEYGDDAFIRLNEDFQRAPLLGMRRAVRRTTGIPAREFHANMVAALEQRYAPRLALPSGALISPGGAGDWAPPIPTERGLITYGRGMHHPAGLYLLPWSAAGVSATAGGDPLTGAGSQWQLLTPASLIDEYSFTADASGSTAVVSVFQIPPSGSFAAESASDLFEIDLTGTGRPAVRRITRDRRLFHPALSPDATRLYAVERVGSYARLVSVGRDGTVSPLYEPAEATLFNPTLSPDGLLLAVAENHRGRQWITVLNPSDGTVIARLADDEAHGEAVGAGPRGDRPAVFGFPRFVSGPDALEIWFSADYDGELALYRWTVAPDGSAPDSAVPGASVVTRVVRDRVAAYAGFPVGGNGAVVYAGYTADGYAIKLGVAESEAAAAPVPSAGLVLDPPVATATAVVPTPLPAPLPGERVYRDLPRPILWVPQFAVRTGSDDEFQLDVGLFFIAASNLERHDLQLSLTYNPWAQEPAASLLYAYTPQVTRWTMRAAHDYTANTGDRSLTAALGAERPLFIQSHPAFTRFLVAAVEAEYQWEQYAPNAITVESVELIAGARLAQYGTAAIRDFYGAGREISTQLFYRPALLDAPEDLLETTNRALFSVQPLAPVRRSIGALQLVPAAAITTSTGGDALGRLPYRSGGFDDRRTTGDSAAPADRDYGWLGSAALRMPLGIYDAAWRGFASTGTGVSLYVEQGGAFDGTTLEPTASTVVGSELSVDLFFNMLPFRLTGGTAFRIPHPSSVTEPAWKVYLALGLGG